MSMAPSLAAAPIAFNWFKAPSVGFWSLPQCVQRLWEFLKDIKKHRGATTFRYKDWELAEALGVRRSCVQKALRWAERLGLIRRFRKYGRDHGRVIEIAINLAAPAPKPAPAARKKGRAGSSIPNVGQVGDASPDQQSAALALAAIKAAADAEAEQHVPTAEEEAEQKAAMAEIRARAAELKIPSGRYKPALPSLSRAMPPPEKQRASQEAELARLEAIPPGQRNDLQEELRRRLAAELARPGLPPAAADP